MFNLGTKDQARNSQYLMPNIVENMPPVRERGKNRSRGCRDYKCSYRIQNNDIQND